jgi:hypothetical protein
MKRRRWPFILLFLTGVVLLVLGGFQLGWGVRGLHESAEVSPVITTPDNGGVITPPRSEGFFTPPCEPTIVEVLQDCPPAPPVNPCPEVVPPSDLGARGACPDCPTCPTPSVLPVP